MALHFCLQYICINTHYSQNVTLPGESILYLPKDDNYELKYFKTVLKIHDLNEPIPF